SHPRGNEAVSECLITIHRQLANPRLPGPHLKFVPGRQQICDRIAIPRLEGHESSVDDTLVFSAEPLPNESLQFFGIEVKYGGEKAQYENILAFIFGRTAERLDSEARNRNTQIN